MKKKMRFFGSPELSDGQSWIYLGSDPKSIEQAVGAWVEDQKTEWGDADSSLSEGELCTVKVVWMTDEEVDALPDI